MSKRIQEAFDNELRIEAVVDFASMWNSLQDSMRVPEQIQDVLDDSYDNKHLHPSMKSFVDEVEKEDEFAPTLVEKLQTISHQQADVIFMQGATPVRNYHSLKVWSSGWGNYYTTWVMAKTYTEGWRLLVKWAKEMHARDLSKWIASSKPKGGAE